MTDPKEKAPIALVAKVVGIIAGVMMAVVLLFFVDGSNFRQPLY